MKNPILNQILNPNNLRQAWEEVAAKNGAPGVDGVSVQKWGRN